MLWSLSLCFLILCLIFDARHDRLHLFTLRPRPIQYDTVFVTRMLLIRQPVKCQAPPFICLCTPVLFSTWIHIKRIRILATWLVMVLLGWFMVGSMVFLVGLWSGYGLSCGWCFPWGLGNTWAELSGDIVKMIWNVARGHSKGYNHQHRPQPDHNQHTTGQKHHLHSWDKLRKIIRLMVWSRKPSPFTHKLTMALSLGAVTTTRP